jgi:hypothetical protein
MLPIIMLVIGIIALVVGRISVTSTKELRRPASIFVGLIFIAPFPLSFLIGFMMGLDAAGKGKQLDPKEIESELQTIALIIVGVCFLLGLILSFALAKPKQKPKKRRRDVDYDDYEDDRPRRPRRDEREDDEDYEDRPRRVRRDDEDDDRPRPRRRDDY